MNTIIIDENMTDFIFDNNYDWHNPPTVNNFCFDKFKILIPRWKVKCIVELKNGTKEGKSKSYYGVPGKTDNLWWNLETHEYFQNGKRIIDYNEIDNPAFDEQELYSFFSGIENILIPCHYIMTAKRDRITISKSENSIAISRKSTLRNENKPKKVYLLDEIIEYVNDNGISISSSVAHEINCPCWSVRGHYRHYKSGKVVFVKNYLKGKKRDTEQPKPKEYFV